MKNRRTAKEIENLLPAIKKVLQKIYDDRLSDVILYGSFAKNQAKQDSDIDLAVVLKGMVNKPKEIDRIHDCLYDLMLESDESISVFPLSDKEIKNKSWPLYYHIKKEGRRI